MYEKKNSGRLANRTRLGFFLAFLLLLFSNLLTFITTQKVIVQDQRVNYTSNIIHKLDNLLRFVYAAEASVFKSREQQTAPGKEFSKNSSYADSVFHDLDSLLKVNPVQLQNLSELKVLVNNRFQEMEIIAKRPFLPNVTGNSSPSQYATNEREIEQLIFKMQSLERSSLTSNTREVLSYAGWIKVFNIISIIIAILLTLFSLLVYNRENKAKKEEAEKADVFREQLQNRVEELAELNKELIDLRSLEKYAVTGRIARTIAHEVRNPLTNINLSIEQLQAEFPPDEMSRMFLDMIYRNSERINQLVSDLLSATRVSELHFSPTSLNQLIDESLKAAADRIELKHIRIEENFSPDVITINVDAEKMKVVFLNIIVNAIEAMKDGGTLKIFTSCQKEKCVIQFSDTGAGMEPDQLNKLFEPYFTTKQKGNGLGLANSQNIVLGHHGSIRAESTTGEGSIFTVLLPLNNKNHE